MSKGSSLDFDDDDLYIDVEEDQRHPCYDGFRPLATGTAPVVSSDATVLSLQAMVDAVVDCASSVGGSPSSSSRSDAAETRVFATHAHCALKCNAKSIRSREISGSAVCGRAFPVGDDVTDNMAIVESSTTSSPRCSPLCGRRLDSDDSEKSPSWRFNGDESPCRRSAGQRCLPDVVQPLSIASALRRHRHSFLIDEILRPDFGLCRRPPADRKQRRLPAQVGAANHVTAIWQPFAESALCCTVAETVASRHPPAVFVDAELARTAAMNGADRKKKSAKRKSRNGGERSFAVQSPVCSSSSSSSSNCSNGSDVSASTTESSTNVTSAGSAKPSQSKLAGQLALPAWVYCTRYSDRPSSGIDRSINQSMS